MNKFEKKFDIIIQGPISDGVLKNFYKTIDFKIVNKVIYSDCSNSIEFTAENLFVAKHEDPGANVGNFSKPLNIDRYLAGISSSLSYVDSEYVLIVRSDVMFSFNKLLEKININKLNVVDVTTKKFWMKKKWEYHFCDWIYFGYTDKLKMMIFNTNYSNLPCEFQDSLFPCSPEYLLTYNYLKYNHILKENVLDEINVIFSKEIKLTSLKPEYVEIPFGINKTYGLKKDDIKNGNIIWWKKTTFYSGYKKIKNRLECL